MTPRGEAARPGRYFDPPAVPPPRPEPQAVPADKTPRVAVYTGSFDPITLGHLDVITRASRIFDGLVVGVGINPDKQPLFSLEERVGLVRAAVAGLTNVRVELFSGLAVTFVREQGAHVLLRGVRSLTDIEAEFTMTLANRKLDPAVETVFLMADAEYSHVSSSLLKQITPLADDARLLRFVPAPVVAALRAKLPAR
jgi:pantetheine-phosphate adenylyltransferase